MVHRLIAHNLALAAIKMKAHPTMELANIDPEDIEDVLLKVEKSFGLFKGNLFEPQRHKRHRESQLCNSVPPCLCGSKNTTSLRNPPSGYYRIVQSVL
jgi:hypothetical protein